MRPTLCAALALLCTSPAARAAPCTGKGVELRVLGSGGPEQHGGRASSSYLVLQDGVARVLVDAGGGSALRFGEAGARMTDLQAILLTHLHADHSADLPALVKSSYFEERNKPLPLLGPPGAAFFPSTTEFARALFDRERGAFRYLSDYLPGGNGPYALQPRDLTLEGDEPHAVLAAEGLRVLAARVQHGPVPAVAYLVELGQARIAFSGDTNGEGPALAKLAAKADLLVAHNAVPEGTTGPARKLHMTPSVIGRIAAQAGVKRLVLSHRMKRSLGREAETLRAVAQAYPGPAVFADDLDCFAP